MRKVTILGAIAAMGMGSAAMAVDTSHTFIEGGYGYSELAGGAAADGDGFNVAGSFELPANFVVSASYRDFDYGSGTGLELSELSAGIAYKCSLGSFDLLSGASFEQLDAFNDKVSGFGLNLDLRGMLTDNVELAAGVSYVDIEEIPTTFTASIGVRRYFTPNFAAGVDIRKSDFLAIGETTINAVLRYSFGQ
jgi:hypothetical protein